MYRTDESTLKLNPGHSLIPLRRTTYRFQSSDNVEQHTAGSSNSSRHEFEPPHIDASVVQSLQNIEESLAKTNDTIDEYHRITKDESEHIKYLHIQMNQLINLLMTQNDKVEQLETMLNEQYCRDSKAYDTKICAILRRYRSDSDRMVHAIREKDARIQALQYRNNSNARLLRIYEEQFDDEEKRELVNLMRFYRRAADIVKLIDRSKLSGKM